MKIINITNIKSLLALLYCVFYPFFAVCQEDSIVKDIFVEIKYKNNEEYRNKALNLSYQIALARYLGWVTLLNKQDIGIIINDTSSKDYVSGYSIENEKFTQDKYSALVTVNFDKQKIEQLLTGKKVDYFLKKGPRTLLIPLVKFKDRLILWDDPNPWFDAWLRRPLDSNLTEFILPSGEVDDLITLNAEEAESLKYYKIKNLTSKYSAEEALVLIVNLFETNNKYSFNLEAYNGLKQEQISLQQLGAKSSNKLNEDLLLLANKFADNYDDMWVKKNIDRIGNNTILYINVYYQNFNEWIKIKNFLKKNNLVKYFKVTSLSYEKADIELSVLSEELFFEEIKKSDFSFSQNKDLFSLDIKND